MHGFANVEREVGIAEELGTIWKENVSDEF
jgi:hypothetical protein